MIPIAVQGATGRLGSVISAAVSAAEDCELVAALGSKDDASQLNGARVVIDVSTAAASRVNLPRMAAWGIDAVVGTTGFTEQDVADLHETFGAHGRRCFLVPNFAIGAVLLMRFAEFAAPWLDAVEIIEMHHNAKVDAPSGTARLTAAKIAAARSTPWAADSTRTESATGARGGVVKGIHVHSVRLPGLLAHEEVIFGGVGQGLTLRHDSFDRSSFAEGALLAARKVHELPEGVTTGLEAILGF